MKTLSRRLKEDWTQKVVSAIKGALQVSPCVRVCMRVRECPCVRVYGKRRFFSQKGSFGASILLYIRRASHSRALHQKQGAVIAKPRADVSGGDNNASGDVGNIRRVSTPRPWPE